MQYNQSKWFFISFLVIYVIAFALPMFYIIVEEEEWETFKNEEFPSVLNAIATNKSVDSSCDSTCWTKWIAKVRFYCYNLCMFE